VIQTLGLKSRSPIISGTFSGTDREEKSLLSPRSDTLLGMNELYLNHPTFGLLYSLCQVDENQALFTTLYAQRLFFRVYFRPPDNSGDPAAMEELVFDPISRNEARQLIEEQMRLLRRAARQDELEQLQLIYKQTFS
jgi:hypothetical protein